ncbi:MAG: squalene/phytoene synthase family protein [Gemmatimonadota bacterium]|nr:MAG: squalene/phytoene synthase family protein [Gemmatimonadota bacterium]
MFDLQSMDPRPTRRALERQDLAVGSIWSPGSLDGVFATAEAVAAKDCNNLYRASCYFRDGERYRAFCASYAIMRIVDDRVDGFLAKRNASAEDRECVIRVVEAWHRIVSVCLSGDTPAPYDVRQTEQDGVDELLEALRESVWLFPVPAGLWDDFFGAMHDDLQRSRFSTYCQFLQYTAGASVAPTTIYLHLITGEPCSEGGIFGPPQDFDIVQCGRALGRFAYIGHILRDLRVDLLTGETGLLYLAADDMATHGVTVESLRRDAESRTASPGLRALVSELVERGRTLASEGRTHLSMLSGGLSADRAFVLELIVGIYEAVLDKIASCSHNVMAERHRLTIVEKGMIAQRIAASLGMTLTT